MKLSKPLFLLFLSFSILILISCFKKNCGDGILSHYDIKEINFVCKNNKTGQTCSSNESIDYYDLELELTFQVNYYAEFQKSGFCLFSSAYAYTPCDDLRDGYKGTSEKIKAIYIFSDQNFDVNHTAGDTLNDLFNISTDTYFGDLNNFFINGDRSFPEGSVPVFRFNLKNLPDQSHNHKFKIHYYQSNGEFYEANASTITIL